MYNNMILKNAAATKSLARKLALEILKDGKPRKGAVVLALVGDLGAGKTTFAQGFAGALGIKGRITSPTFLIIKSYKLKAISYKLLYHIDAYRLHDPKELADLGFEKILKNPQNIVLIEWADKVKKLLPPDTRWLKFRHGEKESERMVDPAPLEDRDL